MKIWRENFKVQKIENSEKKIQEIFDRHFFKNDWKMISEKKNKIKLSSEIVKAKKQKYLKNVICKEY